MDPSGVGQTPTQVPSGSLYPLTHLHSHTVYALTQHTHSTAGSYNSLSRRAKAPKVKHSSPNKPSIFFTEKLQQCHHFCSGRTGAVRGLSCQREGALALYVSLMPISSLFHLGTYRSRLWVTSNGLVCVCVRDSHASTGMLISACISLRREAVRE